jgi:hypothetical protein
VPPPAPSYFEPRASARGVGISRYEAIRSINNVAPPSPLFVSSMIIDGIDHRLSLLELDIKRWRVGITADR